MLTDRACILLAIVFNLLILLSLIVSLYFAFWRRRSDTPIQTALRNWLRDAESEHNYHRNP